MRDKLLESYKRGFDHIKALCNFETILITEEKRLEYKGLSWIITPGMMSLNVDDDTLAKWLYISQKVSELGMDFKDWVKVVENGEEN
ncbi:MAG: hypothetical protein ACRC5T_02535 [Cetobacterium sp.]